MKLQLALFVARSRIVRIAAVLLFAVSALAIGVNGLVRMMQVPSWALAATEVGTADYAMTLPISGKLPLDDDRDHMATSAVIEAARAAGGTHLRIGYVNGVVQLDGNGEVATMLQQQWASNPFPSGYVLQSGRLPSGHTEAVVSPSLAATSPVGSSISLFHGALTLRVVGVIENQASRFANVVAVDSGTLQSLSAGNAKALSRYQVAFAPTLYWTRGQPDAVAAAVAAALGDEVSADQLLAGLTSAAETRESSPPRLAELDLLVTLAPATAAVIATWMISRFLRRLRRTLTQVGVTGTTIGFSPDPPVGLACVGRACK
ncbi:hypothetical protein [Microbacterium luticocti]|uniref:hypothetical protein n=1 Tax=Microbacterium luticocti TaxID=451764 RepID=UPI0004117A3E|nr:hypothetical protein [Microbacterium luticocti]